MHDIFAEHRITREIARKVIGSVEMRQDQLVERLQMSGAGHGSSRHRTVASRHARREEEGAKFPHEQTASPKLMPFGYSDGTCPICHEGINTGCPNGGFFGSWETGGAQAEALRIPHADGTLYPIDVDPDDALMPALLTLSDVMGTGHHAAVTSRVRPGAVAAVIGDGAVGLCAVIAARRLGAERIVIMGRHEARLALARDFGATDVVSERGEEAVARLRDMTGGYGAHSVLECVGSGQAMDTALGIVRTGGAIGRVGVPHYAPIDGNGTFFRNITIAGGPAPTRAYIDELLPEVMEGRIEPGRVFDRTVGLDGVPDGYRAMNDREALKVLIRP